MQPRSHALVIRRALEEARSPRLSGRRGDLLRGNDDEDQYTWPLTGWRTPAIGFTHTYRPGARYGEFYFPSAKTRCVALFGEARAAEGRDPRRAAGLLGRACHLLTDAAVPARTRGHWHYLGDPLESWIEAHTAEMEVVPVGAVPGERAPGELMESLAARSARHPADTTKSLTGLARYALMGRGRRLSARVVEEQALELVPLAIAHVTALLLGFDTACSAGFDRPTLA
jgi:hypothetical protein